MNEGQLLTFGPSVFKTTVSKEFCDFINKCEFKEPANDILAGIIEKEFFFQEKDLKQFYDGIASNVFAYIKACVNHSNNLSGESLYNIDADKFLQDTALMFLDRPWINFQQSGEYNPLHNHIGNMSYVIYPDIPDELYANNKEERTPGQPGNVNGFIEFSYGSYAKFTDDTNQHWNPADVLLPNTTMTFKPKTGDMLLFPSYLHHMVYRFTKPNVERVSVSGNILLKPGNAVKEMEGNSNFINKV